jgi:hypothetical protein
VGPAQGRPGSWTLCLRGLVTPSCSKAVGRLLVYSVSLQSLCQHHKGFLQKPRDFSVTSDDSEGTTVDM